METNRNSIFKISNFMVMVLFSVFLFFLGELWIGSQEEYIEMINNSKISFLIKKSLLSIFVSLVLVLMVYIIGKYIFKIEKKILLQLTKINAILLTLISIASVLYHHL